MIGRQGDHRQRRWEKSLASPQSWFGSSATAEWFTPIHVLDRVQRVLGVIDLDPCSDMAHSVPAVRSFVKDDDGLSQEWGTIDAPSRVFLNPPYGRGSVMPRWIDKMWQEYHSGRVVEVIALIPARTETAWFRTLWQAKAICFWYGRIQFGTSTINAPLPSALVYLGCQPWKFAAVFGDAGKVVRL